MKVRYARVWFLGAFACGALGGAACGSNEPDAVGTSGGAGGASGGATAPTGGVQAMGGSTASGGTAGSGGSVVGTGGTTASGGVAPTGGTTSTGGVAPTGGTTSTGGMAPTGGTMTGGTTNTGGVAPTGGTTSTGGVAPTGGTTSTGGVAPTGGTTGSGGAATGGVTGQQPFKGVANSPAGEIAALGASWCYNWMDYPQASDCDDPYFVPMVWGDGDVQGAIQGISDAGYTTVLGFNEPNKEDQAYMTVERAIQLWPAMTSNPNLRVSSPAVSDDGRAWLEEFMDQVEANGLRVDFIAMHWYGWNAGSCVPGQLEGAVRWAEQWGLPIWITEFGCMGSSNSSEQVLLDFFPGAVAMLENHPLVERYAWYPWNTYNHLYLEDASDVRMITPLGELFAEAPAYR